MGEKREMVTVCVVILLPLALTIPYYNTCSICCIFYKFLKSTEKKLPSSVCALHPQTDGNTLCSLGLRLFSSLRCLSLMCQLDVVYLWGNPG